MKRNGSYLRQYLPWLGLLLGVDALAALPFGILVLQSVVDKGYTESGKKFRIMSGSSILACVLLLAVYMLQVALVIIMAYGGNDLYFKVNKPQRCLMVARRGECIEDLIKKVGRYKKQYNIQQVAWLDQPDLLTCVDHADAVFLYELSVRERTDLVEYCYQTRKDLYYSLEMSDVVAMAGERVMFDDKTMMYCPVRELRFEERIVKRLGDILVSVVGLVLTSPILLATALAIRLEDGGPVFYRQKRATYGGRVFEVYKFRSMRAQDGSIHVSAKKDDDRITRSEERRVGKECRSRWSPYH